MVAYLQRLGMDAARAIDAEQAEPDLELHEERERRQVLADSGTVAARTP